MDKTKRMIPVKEGLWTTPRSPNERPQLIASRCSKCGELFFPQRRDGMCSHCQSRDLRETLLSRRGKIYSYTVVMQRPPFYYKAEVPYAIGFVELPEGIRVETLFTGCDLDSLRVGMDVEMVIETLHEDEQGNAIVAYKFRPVAG